ncbi:DUF6093 family protein [Streptomyces sp. SCL15-4]|uniref:DUF6093 family protein n=1 Tax=Streptomyces sp. SCL15-4 TaxID=2967221 RepID=UPI002965E34B|nr:DUF6093 family protein [Streptomyces sp. SCL15-4]
MSLDAVLAAGRRAAEARMRDTVRLYAQAPDVFDRGSGNTVPGEQTTLYSGKARVKAIAASTGEETEAGEREVVLREYEVQLPWAASLPAGTRIMPGMRIEVTSSPDARMVGLILWVAGATFSDQSTAWRIRTEDRS